MSALPDPDQLDLVFAALAHPTRRQILMLLAIGDAPVSSLQKPFEISQPAISKHLKVLENAGLVSRTREGQQRPVHVNAAALQGAAMWLGDYQKFFESSFDNLAIYVKELQQKEEQQKKAEKKPAKKKTTSEKQKQK